VVLERRFEWRVGVVLLVSVAWGSGSLLVYRRNPSSATAWWSLAMDLAVSGAAIAVSNLGSDQNRIVGGYPLITVAIAAVRGRRAAWVAAGVLLAVVIASVSRNPEQNVIVENLSDIIFYAAGAFTFGWALEVLRDSDRERIGAERALLETEARHARGEERAEISRRLHDSVLQTLALIQRQAGDEPEVVRLARAQERELRGWLFAEPGAVGGRFAERLQMEAADVEARYRCVIDVVVVGDCDVTAKVESLLAAGREAMVNAAVHAPGERVSVYAECDDGRCRLFVRDRHVCAYCGGHFAELELTVEHILPVSRGGRHEWTNVVTACRSCNTRKGSRRPEEANMPLLYVPYAVCRNEGFILSNRRILADQMAFLQASLPRHSRWAHG